MISDNMDYNTLSFTTEEQKTLHWDGIVAVCTGKFKNLSEAKEHLGKELTLKKGGLQGPLLDSISNDPATANLWIADFKGKKWGDIWYDGTSAQMESVKKELRKVYVDLALEPEGRWRLGVKKMQLEEQLLHLKKDLGLTQM